MFALLIEILLYIIYDENCNICYNSCPYHEEEQSELKETFLQNYNEHVYDPPFVCNTF